MSIIRTYHSRVRCDVYPVLHVGDHNFLLEEVFSHTYDVMWYVVNTILTIDAIAVVEIWKDDMMDVIESLIKID